jgi:hypothetical protein
LISLLRRQVAVGHLLVDVRGVGHHRVDHRLNVDALGRRDLGDRGLTVLKRSAASSVSSAPRPLRPSDRTWWHPSRGLLGLLVGLCAGGGHRDCRDAAERQRRRESHRCDPVFISNLSLWG